MMNLQQEMSRICSHIQRLTGIRCTLLEAPDGQWPGFPCACGSCQTVIHEVSRCIESHLTEKIALEEAAAHVHFSRSCLCRIIKGEAGCTFTEYLNQLRIERSKTYLYRSHLTLPRLPAGPALKIKAISPVFSSGMPAYRPDGSGCLAGARKAWHRIRTYGNLYKNLTIILYGFTLDKADYA